jgi:UDP-N-acetylmuramate--alanine ligase
LKQGDIVGSVKLGVPGLHNVLNALAVIAVADLLEIPFDLTRKVLGQFGGVGRRFEVKGDVKGILVVDDYAHHPTEIKATLAAARSAYPGRRIWAVFQPHTFSRTKVLMKEFANSFVDADQVIVLDIYASREVDDLDVHSADLVARMEDTDARYIGDRRSAAGYLLAHLEPNDLVITLGAGDGDEVGNWVLEGLEGEAAHVQ